MLVHPNRASATRSPVSANVPFPSGLLVIWHVYLSVFFGGNGKCLSAGESRRIIEVQSSPDSPFAHECSRQGLEVSPVEVGEKQLRLLGNRIILKSNQAQRLIRAPNNILNLEFLTFRSVSWYDVYSRASQTE